MSVWSQENRWLRIHCAQLPSEVKVISLEVREGLAKSIQIRVEVELDPTRLEIQALLQQTASIEVQQPLHERRYFHGLILEIRQDKSDDAVNRYFLLLGSVLEKLKSSKNNRIFENKSVLEITQQILMEYGIADYHFKRVLKQHPKLEICSQYQESDYQFLQRILTTEGIYYVIEHHQKSHMISFVDQNTTLEKLPVPIHFRNLRHWRSVFCSSIASNDYDYRNPTRNLAIKIESKDRWQRMIYPGGYRTHAEGMKKLQRLQQLEQCHSECYRGSGDAWGADAGSVVSVMELNKTHFIITDIHHVFLEPSLHSGKHYRNECRLLPYQIEYIPKIAFPKPIINVQLATVIEASDKFASVVIQFHWEQGQENQRRSRVRVLSPWASQDSGIQCLPKKGAQVLIDFLYGDPDRPIVLGCLYDQQQTLPYDPVNHPYQSGIRSTTHRGNELRFDDDPNHPEVRLQAANDLNVNVQKNSRVMIHGQQNIRVTNGDFKVTVEQGRCEFTAKDSIRLRVGQTFLELKPECIVLNGTQIKMDTH